MASLTRQGHLLRGASTMMRGSVGPAAIGMLMLDSCSAMRAKAIQRAGIYGRMGWEMGMAGAWTY